VRGIRAGARLQLALYRRQPDALIPLVNGPLFAIIFLMVVRHGGRPDLSGYAVVAPVFIALWWFALFHGGLVVQNDRWSNTLELHVAAPTSFAAVVFGRILTVTTVGLVSFVEVWLVARFLLRTEVAVHHPVLLTATLVVTAFAMAATALFMAGLFVLARSAVTFANSASFPFYVLGGILVPVTFLPGWIQPVSKLVFLSWSADLLRASLAPGPVPDAAFRIGMVALLGVAGFALSAVLLRRILGRVRASGELGLR
jgi:ABC-2 type transport system permease protein